MTYDLYIPCSFITIILIGDLFLHTLYLATGRSASTGGDHLMDTAMPPLFTIVSPSVRFSGGFGLLGSIARTGNIHTTVNSKVKKEDQDRNRQTDRDRGSIMSFEKLCSIATDTSKTHVRMKLHRQTEDFITIEKVVTRSTMSINNRIPKV